MWDQITDGKIVKSCYTCKYFVPPGFALSSYDLYPGDPWECTEPEVGSLMMANPPVRKCYCKRWTPKKDIISLWEIGKYRLKKPVQFKVTYDSDEDLLGFENEELAIYGYGSTHSEVLDDLESSLESLIIGLSAFPEEKLNKKSLEIKKKLAEYIDLNGG